MATQLPPVYLEFKGDIKGIQESLKKIEGELKQYQAHTKKAGDSAKGMSAKTVAAGAIMASVFQKVGAEVFKFGKETVTAFQDTAKEIRTLQRSIGGTAEDVSRLRFAGEELGLTTQQMTMGFKALAGHLDANDDKIKRMGISYRDAKGELLPTKDIMANLAEQFAAMPNGLQKTAMATDLFGKSGQKMIPILNQGKKGLQELYKESDKLGLTMSGKDLEASKKFGLEQKKLHAAIKGVQIAIGRELIPKLTLLVDYIRINVVPWFKSFANGLTGKDGVNDGLNSATTFAHNFGKMLRDTIGFVIKYKDQLALLAAVIISIWAGMKISSAVTAIVATIGLIAAAWTGVATAAGAAAVVEDVASGGALTTVQIAAGIAGTAAVAGAIALAYTKLKSSLPSITPPAPAPGDAGFIGPVYTKPEKPPKKPPKKPPGGGGDGKTPEQTLLQQLKEETKKMRARIALIKTGASKGLIDAVMGSANWQAEYEKLKKGGRTVVLEMQKIYNNTEAGISEIAQAHAKLAKEAKKSAEATTKSNKSLENSAKAAAEANRQHKLLNTTVSASNSWMASQMRASGPGAANAGSFVEVPVIIDGQTLFRVTQKYSLQNDRRNVTNGLTRSGSVI